MDIAIVNIQGGTIASGLPAVFSYIAPKYRIGHQPNSGAVVNSTTCVRDVTVENTILDTIKSLEH